MKVAVYEREGMTEESIQYWRERFKDRCTVVTSGFAWVDFVPFTTNKAKGIRKYQELWESDRMNAWRSGMNTMILK